MLSSFIQKSVAAIENKVDKKAYADAELISIKTTLHLPYYSSSPEFERVYGSININGQDYEYVKRRVYNDTLEVLCLPNGDKTKLKLTGNDVAKAAADGNADTNKKPGNSLKVSLPDFFQPVDAFSVVVHVEAANNYPSSQSHFCFSDFSAQPGRPPQTV